MAENNESVHYENLEEEDKEQKLEDKLSNIHPTLRKTILKEKKDAKKKEFIRLEAIRKAKEEDDRAIELNKEDKETLHPTMKAFMSLKKSEMREV